MRWYTCTPKPYAGDKAFFARDSGLISRGFQAIGIESRAILPGEPQTDDEPDLIRTDYDNLISPEWWRSQGLDGVVLYSWALPRFNKIAEAISRAGIQLVLNQDSGGLIFPLVSPAGHLREQYTCNRIKYGLPLGLLTLAIWMTYRLTVGFVRLEFGRMKHLCFGNVISCVSPLAVERYRAYVRRMGKPELMERVWLVPHPVAPYFNYNSALPKEYRVVAVGRWEDEQQKRSRFLLKTIEISASADPLVHFDIVGNIPDHVSDWHQSLLPDLQRRVNLLGKVTNKELPGIYQRSSVLLCSSSHESFHIPAAEALCCGCSVVAPRLAALPSFEWFCEKNSGTLAKRDTPESLAGALGEELSLWEGGQRDGNLISQFWTKLLQAPYVCRRILECVSVATP